MNQAAMITGIIGLLAALFLVVRHGAFARLGMSAKIKMGLIWVAIILGLVLVLRVIGVS